MSLVSRGFHGRRDDSGGDPSRVPPGQYLTDDFPVLSIGPTPHTPLEEWTFTIASGGERTTWTWEEFRQLPSETVTVDIHCVTKWSKLGTSFRGVSVDTLFEAAEPLDAYAMAHSFGGYTTNLAIEDLTDGRAWVVTEHEGEPLPRQHGFDLLFPFIGIR